jgi:hypothetical protein
VRRNKTTHMLDLCAMGHDGPRRCRATDAVVLLWGARTRTERVRVDERWVLVAGLQAQRTMGKRTKGNGVMSCSLNKLSTPSL